MPRHEAPPVTEPIKQDPTFLAMFGSEKSVRLKAGTVLFEKDDPAQHMYVVKKGTIRLHHGDVTLEIVEPGGMFGEMAIVDHLDRSASATAVTDCELAEINEEQFLTTLRHAPMFGLNLLRLVTRRLRAMYELLDGMKP